MYILCTLLLFSELFGKALLAPIDATSRIGELTYMIRNTNYSYTSELDNDFTVPLLIRKDGYQAEAHIVQTEDGYLLTLHRIRGPEGSPPVFLQHGLSGSSADWIIPGRGKAFGYILADLGYDVWLGNFRGNRYSRSHVSMSSNFGNAKYWDFSWQETGFYDLPAAITYVTEITKQPLEAYAGHSMGTTSYYVMASERPEFQKKVGIMLSFAPAAFLSHMTGLSRVLLPFAEQIRLLFYSLGIHQFPPFDNEFRPILKSFCTTDPNFREICKYLLFLVMGFDYEQFDDALLSKIVTFDPSGMSAKMFIHYAQLVTSGHFRKYDYGPQWNMKFYNSTVPPDYDLSKVTTPVMLIYAENDFLTPAADVERLRDLLPNVIESYKVPHPKYNHLDVIWGIDAPKLVFERVVYVLQNYKKMLAARG